MLTRINDVLTHALYWRNTGHRTGPCVPLADFIATPQALIAIKPFVDISDRQ